MVVVHQHSPDVSNEASGFGDYLRHWRALRRHSQLSLSLVADISARHLSFLESGRSRPSREMVLRLADALAMPKEVANQALNVAGFASVYPALEASSQELAPVRRAMEMMLNSHDPYPAFAINRHWDVIGANKSALFLLSKLPMPVDMQPNLIEILIISQGTEFVENWMEVASLSISRIKAEEIAFGGDDILAAKREKLEAHVNACDGSDEVTDYHRAVVPSVFLTDGRRLTLFSTIASFSTVQDVSASDIRIELMFPEDEETEAFFKSLDL